MDTVEAWQYGLALLGAAFAFALLSVGVAFIVTGILILVVTESPRFPAGEDDGHDRSRPD